MAIDRARRARRRRERRLCPDDPSGEPDGIRTPVNGAGGDPSGSAGTERAARRHIASAPIEVEGLFNAGAKHQLERLEWVAVAREDERESGAGPLDLDSGVVRLTPRHT